MAAVNTEGTDLITAAVAISQERSKLLGQIRGLLETGDNQKALQLMREYCGLTNGKKSTGIN